MRMNENIEKVLAALDGFRMSDEMTYSAYSALHDEISSLNDLLEAREPKFVPDIAEAIIGCKPKVKVGHCPSCDTLMYETDRFCRKCGQAVKWK